jgi:tRNA(fMet)-specific endonuclease VapC
LNDVLATEVILVSDGRRFRLVREEDDDREAANERIW